jgi:predicted RNA-binding Zn ribbon-like protein
MVSIAFGMPNRPRPLFVGDHPALDFLNTVATPVDVPVEWLAHGQDLVDWLEQTKMIDCATAHSFRAEPLRGLDETARKARALREWLRRFVKKHAGRTLPKGASKELREINELLARDQMYFQIQPAADEDSLCLRPEHVWTTAEQLLQPLALSIGNLVCAADFRLIRSCEGPSCTLMFYDRTKGHARRWCSMAVCGNRAKVAAFRTRQK